MTGYDKITLRKRARALYVDGHVLYAQIGNKLCFSDDNGLSWRTYPFKLVGGARTYSRLHARLTRRGIHCLRVLRDGNLLLVAKRSIFLYDHRREQIVRSFTIPRGSRPLFICDHKGGDLIWGEYLRNAERDRVNIYVSGDRGSSWQAAYTFQMNTIRHIHGVFHDPFDDRIWVTTGDEDPEANIWVTENKFRTLEKVIGGNQQARAIQLLFTHDYVYFGTDTPFEINHICRIDKSTGRVEELAPVNGSVYWGCRVGEALFFSTAVEPSRVNIDNVASIWGSNDGKDWRRITDCKKDFWPSKACQIGQIYLPQGENHTGHLFYTPVATEGDQTLRRIGPVDLLNRGL